MSGLQGMSKNKGKAAPSKDRGLKRRRISPGNSLSATNTAEFTESEEPLPSSSASYINTFEETDIVFKTEPMDDEGADGSPPADQKEVIAGLEEDMIEELKIEYEDDPLMMYNESKASILEANNTLTSHEKYCDEGFSPGSSENLPLIDALTVTEFLAALPDYDKVEIRALWRQPREFLNDTIGYVQVKQDDTICTVKCVVATKTTSNNCTITYNEVNNTVQTTFCDCTKQRCSHVPSALIWLSRREAGLDTYWLQPMITTDPQSMTISAIFGYPKKKILKKCNFLEEFVNLCKEKKVFTPAIMQYHQEDERTKASLHKLMCKFKRHNRIKVLGFLDYCQKEITNEDCVNALENMSPEVRQELEYGRITDALLHEVSQATDGVEALVQKIILPDAQEREEVNAGIIQSLEKSMKMTIKKCGLLISSTSPIFSATPYGITTTHVVHLKYQEDDSDERSGQILSAKNNACMQLQMFLAQKKHACFCIVHKTNRIDIMIVQYNPTWIYELIGKATKFWKTHIFKCINMENVD